MRATADPGSTVSGTGSLPTLVGAALAIAVVLAPGPSLASHPLPSTPTPTPSPTPTQAPTATPTPSPDLRTYLPVGRHGIGKMIANPGRPFVVHLRFCLNPLVATEHVEWDPAELFDVHFATPYTGPGTSTLRAHARNRCHGFPGKLGAGRWRVDGINTFTWYGESELEFLQLFDTCHMTIKQRGSILKLVIRFAFTHCYSHVGSYGLSGRIASPAELARYVAADYARRSECTGQRPPRGASAAAR